MTNRASWRRLVDGDDGLGLVEVMVSIFVLGVALLALASVAMSSLTSMRITRDREQAVNAASAAIEDARARDFPVLALQPGTVDVSAIPAEALPSGASDACFVDEPVVTDAVVSPIAFHRTAGPQGRIDVFTIVTYADASCPSDRSDIKRVTAIATWQDGGVVRAVTQETLVTHAGRGLPVPRFEIRPPQSSLTFSHAFLDDPDTENARCIEHQLRNLGAEDSYQFEVVDASAGSVTLLGTADGFRVGDWNVTAYLEYPASQPTGGEWPPDGDQLDGAPPRPVSDARIEPGSTAKFTVCYEPATGTLDPAANVWPSDVDVTIEVSSRFDDRQIRTLLHHVAVRDQAHDREVLYLFEQPNDHTAHARPKQGSSFLPSVMGPLADPSDSPELVSHLGDIDYTQTSRSNWSVGYGSNNYPGVRFRPRTTAESVTRSASEYTLGWHHQFSTSTVLLPDAELVLWTAPVNALAGAPLPADGQPVTLEVRVDGLNSNENTNNPFWNGVTTTVTYVHTSELSSATNGWMEVRVPIDLGGEMTFTSGRYLRLRVTCAPTNTVDCNVAHDNVAHPSRLYVQVK